MKTKISRYDVMTIKLVNADEILMFSALLIAGRDSLKEYLTGYMSRDAVHMADIILSAISDHALNPADIVFHRPMPEKENNE